METDSIYEDWSRTAVRSNAVQQQDKITVGIVLVTDSKTGAGLLYVGLRQDNSTVVGIRTGLGVRKLIKSAFPIHSVS
jgi:hypothetical protein